VDSRAVARRAYVAVAETGVPAGSKASRVTNVQWGRFGFVAWRRADHHTGVDRGPETGPTRTCRFVKGVKNSHHKDNGELSGSGFAGIACRYAARRAAAS